MPPYFLASALSKSFFDILVSSFIIFSSHPLQVDLLDLAYSTLKSPEPLFAAFALFLPFPETGGALRASSVIENLRVEVI